ncbi:hypothetical protein HHK36_013621 [Tetracentron sinense]|uniref:SET domain-containing protein n=1 Tax=Tetracentron sinense TaxID=13715 RepID=A0A835DHI7_TETSI|nr:hypothetical protein HHK36_013621 [Tetracentron sinense]
MEDLRPVSEINLSDEPMESDDNYSLVLKLSEKDPLFEKKKKLLQSKGSGPEVRVYLESSPSSKWINSTLEAMLWRARIINLDEAELYFGGVTGVDVVEFYSPRNELESFNSIISLTDISLLSATHKRKEALQDLRDATVDMIRAFGDKNIEETIIEECSCDSEKILLQWGGKHGVRTKLQIAHVEGAGRGAVAVEDLQVGDTALEIPESIIICEELVYESSMSNILKKIDGISSETMILLWSMKERYNPNSKFKIYFNALPEAFNTGLSFGIDALTALQGTLLLEEIMHAKEHLRIQYDELFPALCSDHPDIFQPELYTWDQFLWACELWYSNGMKVMFTDGKLRTCLIPIAGLLNHSLCPHIMHYGKVDSSTNSLKFSLSRPCRVGEQCYLSYGNFSSSHLITFYGFLPKGDNYNDVIPLDIDDAQADPNPDETTHMVRGTWLSNNHEIFNYGLPPSLLDRLRDALCDAELHTKTCTKKNLENEMAVLKSLQSIFDSMMDELDDLECFDRKNINLDVKLALEFKDIQRRIVSSVLTSCYAGLNILENKPALDSSP